jgi:hypothetical protein
VLQQSSSENGEFGDRLPEPFLLDRTATGNGGGRHCHRLAGSGKTRLVSKNYAVGLQMSCPSGAKPGRSRHRVVPGPFWFVSDLTTQPPTMLREVRQR